MRAIIDASAMQNYDEFFKSSEKLNRNWSLIECPQQE